MTTTTGPRQWAVLINDEDQYSLFPSELAVPGGWREAGFTGDREACRRYVDEHWTDMRPASLRRAMDGAGSG
ncbi:MbtH family NRPS accessory protein [Dactylosporangium roseum]|uniref:MbtH family NRPS accessory protein n=1 Tax=Dactylosporangium roseum TaxID=47989 RepID=A0ABY5ZBU4_9ACTN|nr:MbtH family NRPS accessory protein [Dactylosporangium roseum]UWZ39124.1 MbtH family NRPS accessory protein [Dactylosporangium roseum]